MITYTNANVGVTYILFFFKFQEDEACKLLHLIFNTKLNNKFLGQKVSL